MKSWRERIAEAEERRTRVPMVFTDADKVAIMDPGICMVGEAAAATGQRYTWLVLDSVIAHYETKAIAAVRNNDDLRAASRSLDAIEDRALALKAGGGVVTPTQATPSGPDTPRGESLAHPLADFALNRPRSFAALTDAEVCRGTAVERVKCRNGAGNCAREFNCND